MNLKRQRMIGSAVMAAVVLPFTASAGTSATGGTETLVGTDYVHTFTNAGTFTASTALTNVQILLVGGGGAGGANAGGGGGAGGVVYLTNVTLAAGSYTVNVGTGGVNLSTQAVGGQGGDSSFGTLTNAFGGGGGGCWTGQSPTSGGSGGGGGSKNDGGTVGAAGIAGQGSAGGTATGSCGGGGGGAVTNGTDATATIGGNGGDGITNSITGTAVVYGGGGGGGACNYATYTAGVGGAGGGGKGGDVKNVSNSDAVAGTDGLGGGGGGGGNQQHQYGAKGGSGVVIVRYPAANGSTDPILVFSGVSDVTVASATLAGSLVTVGTGASSCALKVVYGLAPDSLVFTNTLASAATAGAFSYPLAGLAPGRTWSVAILAENDKGASVLSLVLSFATAAEAGLEAGQAGLHSGTLAGAFNLTGYPSVTNIVLSPEMANTKSGWGDSTTYIYWGQMYFNGGAYQFGTTIDDSTYFAVWTNGVQTTLLNIANGYNQLNLSDAAGFAPAAGWYDVELRIGNGNGGAGPSYYASGWGGTCGFAYSVDNLTQTDFASFTAPKDSGDGSLLRTAPIIRTVAVASWSLASGALTAALSVGGGTVAADVYIAYGASYGGNATNGWATVEKLGTVTAAAATDFAVTAHDVGSAVYVRFFTITADGAMGCSETLTMALADLPQLGAVAVSDVAFTNATVGITLVSTGPGGSCALTVEYGTTAAFGSTADIGTVTAGTYARKLTGLAPGATYYYRIRAVGAAGAAVSATGTFTMGGASVVASATTVVCPVHTATITANLTTLGAGETTLSLYAGQGQTAAAAASGMKLVASQTAAATGAYTFAYTGDFTNLVSYYVLCSNNFDGTVWTSTTATNSYTTDDYAVYTWKGGSSGNWNDANNWASSTNDCFGYPVGTQATAVWTNTGFAVTTRLVQAESCGTVVFTNADLDVTLLGVGGVQKLTCPGTARTGHHLNLVFDSISIQNEWGDALNGGASAFTLQNGAYLKWGTFHIDGATNTVCHITSGSHLLDDHCYLGGTNSTLFIDDGYVDIARGNFNFNCGNVPGPVRVVLSGPGARLYVSAFFAAVNAYEPPTVEFVVPVGGYTNVTSGTLGGAPIWSSGSTAFADSANSKTNIVLAVSAESPISTGTHAGGDYQLIAWNSTGINTNLVTFARLPRPGTDYFYYTYDSTTNRTGITVTGVGVHLEGRQGFVIRICDNDIPEIGVRNSPDWLF